ncbi:hypothetical protein LPTSP4_08420 [Leptospira ryugenii]|uniref:Uncharacterized protein n=1 Tax=Leptospira ryugenii TaxID=1917863 RepID=A0A2P2DXH1_9LEPT|nr:hypothetical protein LPTSP4_08420 [Leptospira ryugenii]
MTRPFKVAAVVLVVEVADVKVLAVLVTALETDRVIVGVVTPESVRVCVNCIIVLLGETNSI